jgi:hypothetical protein
MQNGPAVRRWRPSGRTPPGTTRGSARVSPLKGGPRVSFVFSAVNACSGRERRRLSGRHRQGGTGVPPLSDETGDTAVRPSHSFNHWMRMACPRLDIAPSALQGFNPGLGVLMRCALKGHQNAARRVEFISPQKRSVILAPLSGRILDGGYPGLKPSGLRYCPAPVLFSC